METEIRTAKLFRNGASQAVRLPAEYRFEGSEVYIRRDERTGEIVLSPKTRKTWASFVALREQLRSELAAEGLEDFMKDRNQPPGDQQRDPFKGWRE